MSIFEAMILVTKSTIIGIIISLLGGNRFLIPVFTDIRAVFLHCVFYLTGFHVPSTVACICGCTIVAMVFYGNIFALLPIGISCLLLRLIARCEHASQSSGGEKNA